MSYIQCIELLHSQYLLTFESLQRIGEFHDCNPVSTHLSLYFSFFVTLILF